MFNNEVDEETAATISSEKGSDERTNGVYNNIVWEKILTKQYYQIVRSFDKITQASMDSIVLSILCALPALCSGATVSQEKDAKGRPIILFFAYFARSGMGKSVLANTVRKYMLFWLDDFYTQENKKSKDSVFPDVFLDAASAEGFEQSIFVKSAIHFFVDEYGKLYRASKNDTVKASLLRALMQIFDSGVLITRKLKDSKRSQHLMVQGMGLYAASTIGPSNLTQSDMRDMISDGMLNRFLVIFGEFKEIPIRQELSKNDAESIERFARTFHEYASEKSFYLGHEATEIYQQFHQSINQRFRQKYDMYDDTAGFEIRLLTIVQRIAMLLQVCINIENTSPHIIEISGNAMGRAVQMLNYLHQKHFQKVLLYAQEKTTGKATLEEKIKKQLKKDEPQVLRTIVRNVSPAKTDEVRDILDYLVEINWAKRDGVNIYSKNGTDTDRSA
ncbi:DUF3987 domain-containing protein [Sulfuricurvum sp.]|uniref:DUF3987 domain-containing protein n=1 Tax=Sulfuricurvum sp. TaxID=2025608 RepID=UPI002E34D2EC|nr:DUF3987 domain-containing protein [Sulfuricurvum sp.]HEX5328917.1 DUF3987 domain-containing protein [Sulfuricurvum sp.]